MATPTQVFTVVLDTGRSNLWVIDCACRGPNCKGDPDSGYKKHCYNPKASSQMASRSLSITAKAKSADIWERTSSTSPFTSST